MSITITDPHELMTYGLNPEFGEDNATFITLNPGIFGGQDGKACVTKDGHKDDKACPTDSKCARPGTVLQKGDPLEFVCCPTNAGDFIGDDLRAFCKGQPNGTVCRSHQSCLNGACGHLGLESAQKQCCANGQYTGDDWRSFCAREPAGTPCEGDRGCLSGNCDKGVCSSQTKTPIGTEIENVLFVVTGSIIAILVVIIILYIVRGASR